MSYRCTMSRIRWLSGPAVLAIALVGTGCRGEGERAEGAVREPGTTTGDRDVPPDRPRQPPGQDGRDQAERLGDKAEQLAREGQELGREAREQAERVGDKAEQLAERGRQVGSEVSDQMNRVGEQTGALKDDRGQAGSERAGQPAAPQDQQPQDQQGKDGQQDQTAGAGDKAQSGSALASARDAWTEAAKDNDFQVSFNRDGAVIATKEDKGADKRPPDQELRNAVGGKLANSDHEAVRKLNVTVRDGVVTLQGSVGSVKEATEAVKEAMDAEGVTKVISHVRHGS